MMMFSLLFVALAVSSVSAGTLDADLGADDSYSESYDQAQEFIEGFLQKIKIKHHKHKTVHKDTKKKCDAMIKASKDGVKKIVIAEQTRVNKLDNGKHCFSVGKNQMSVAISTEHKAALNLKKARKKLADAMDTPIIWKYLFSKVSEKNPSMFFKAPQYLRVKALVKKLRREVQIAKGVLHQAKTTHTAAIKTKSGKMLKCRCDTYTKMQNEIKMVNVAIHKANIKAWTKAAHLKCILGGTPIAKCAVKAIPKVHAPKLARGVGKSACHQPDKDLLKDKCHGWQVDQQCSKGKVAFQSYSKTVWHKNRKYECRTGWHQPKAADYFKLMKSKGCYSNRNRGDHPVYGRCGWRGYNYGSQHRYYYTFSDTVKNSRYQHNGNYVGYQNNKLSSFARSATVGNWAGIVCMKD